MTTVLTSAFRYTCHALMSYEIFIIEKFYLQKYTYDIRYTMFRKLNECKKFVHVPGLYISVLILNSRSKIETQASVNLKKKTIMHVITHITLGLKGQTA